MFTPWSYTMVHTDERPLSCSVCDYQCRRDCDLKPSNDTCVLRRHKSPSRIHCRFHIFYVSQLYTEPTWPHCHLRPIHTKRVYVRRRPSTSVDVCRRPSTRVDVRRRASTGVNARRRAWFGQSQWPPHLSVSVCSILCKAYSGLFNG